jgi:AAA domain
MRTVYSAYDVFTPGTQPGVNAVQRSDSLIEEGISEYLKWGRGSILVVAGASKTGKTVLVKRYTQELRVAYVTAGELKQNPHKLWSAIVELVDPQLRFETSASSSVASEITAGGKSGLSLGNLVSVEGHLSGKSGTQKTFTTIERPDPDLSSTAKRLLNLPENRDVVIVIDDFHRLSVELQERLTGIFKDVIFTGIAVILISIPHRSSDIITRNAEMIGRVQVLRIPLWTDEELLDILLNGFQLLNAKRDERLFRQIISESHRSPYITQKICLEICRLCRLETTQPKEVILCVSSLKNSFFENLFNGDLDTRGNFRRIVSDIKPRKPRNLRLTRTGKAIDIYGIVFRALIQHNGLAEITPATLVVFAQQLLEHTAEVPSPQEFGRVLTKLNEQALKHADPEPVLEYQDEQLIVVEPFFLYYIQWKSGLIELESD